MSNKHDSIENPFHDFQFIGAVILVLRNIIFRKNIERHTAHAIIFKQWLMVHTSDLIMKLF